MTVCGHSPRKRSVTVTAGVELLQICYFYTVSPCTNVYC